SRHSDGSFQPARISKSSISDSVAPCLNSWRSADARQLAINRSRELIASSQFEKRALALRRSQIVGWAKRSMPTITSGILDGGHVANASLPTLDSVSKRYVECTAC